MVRRAAELGRRRGTVGGHRAGARSSPSRSVPLRIEDNGGVIWSSRRTRRRSRPAAFIVYCDKPVAEDDQAAIARCIERYKPVHTTYRLRVKAPKKKV